MRELTERYKELARKSGRYPLLKIELYEGSRNNWSDTVAKTISGQDYIKSATYTSGTTTRPNKFETGISYCAEFSAVLAESVYTDVKTSQKIKVYTGFVDFENNSEIWAALGVFFVEAKTLESDGVHIKGRDLMMYAEKAWLPYKLTYPCTLTEVYKDIVSQMGGQVDEDYTLPVEAKVLEAPYLPSDPNVIYKAGETELSGNPYTCRQALAQVAKIQLGNAYIDGDGVPKFYSYASADTADDNMITGISIGDDFYTNLGVFYAYGDRTQEQVKGEETFGTIVFFTSFPIEDLSEAYYDMLKEQAKKACGWAWKDGVIERKGQGNAEPGDLIEYSGKYGIGINFFVNGITMEWQGSSYDETIYSFAPTYEDSVYSSNNTDSATSEVESNASAAESGGGLTIEKAVVITEKDAAYLLHEYTEVEYINGNRICYGSMANPVICSGNMIWSNLDTAPAAPTYLVFERGKRGAGGTVGTNFYIKTVVTAVSGDGVYDFEVYCGSDVLPETQVTSGRTANMSDSGVALLVNMIYPPTGEFPYGYIHIKDNKKTWETGATTPSFGGYGYEQYVGFSSEAEYNAAIGLTYEPNVLTAVNETLTEV